MKYTIIENVPGKDVFHRVPHWYQKNISKHFVKDEEMYTIIEFRDKVVLSRTVKKALKDAPEGKPIVVVAHEFTMDSSHLLNEHGISTPGHQFGWTDERYKIIRESS
jgi:hypothetical protein